MVGESAFHRDDPLFRLEPLDVIQQYRLKPNLIRLLLVLCHDVKVHPLIRAVLDTGLLPSAVNPAAPIMFDEFGPPVRLQLLGLLELVVDVPFMRVEVDVLSIDQIQLQIIRGM